MFHSVILGSQVAKLRNGLTRHDKPPEDATSHTTPPLRRMKLKMLICTEIQGMLARWPRTNMLIKAGFVDLIVLCACVTLRTETVEF